MAILTWLGLPGNDEDWSALGFTVTDGSFDVGHVRCECTLDPAWGFDRVDTAAALGVPTERRDAPSAPVLHANGIDRIDHIVYAVPDLDDAIERLGAAIDMPPTRRARPRGPDGPEMAFYRVGEGFIEVAASGRPPALWGIAFSAPDLDATVSAIREAGGPVGDPKRAVQGGRIASVWKGHVGWGVAIMEPPRSVR